MPDLRYSMTYTIVVDDREFKLIGKALTEKLDGRIDRQAALALCHQLNEVRRRTLAEQMAQTERIRDRIVEHAGEIDYKFSISSAASGSEASSES